MGEAMHKVLKECFRDLLLFRLCFLLLGKKSIQKENWIWYTIIIYMAAINIVAKKQDKKRTNKNNSNIINTCFN